MPQTLQSYYFDFWQYLKFQKGYSSHTIAAYKDDLEAFGIFLDARFGSIPAREVKSVYIKTWLASLKEQGISSRTISRKISSLRSLFKFLLKRGVIEVSPMQIITAPKIARKLPSFIKETELSTLFDHVEFTPDFSGSTHRLILTLLYQTGMRRAELISLQHQQVDFHTNTIRILGKGNKERVVPVSIQLITQLGAYQALKKNLFADATKSPLLVTEKGKPLYARYVHNVCTRYLAEVTTLTKKSPHVLRHSFATHLYNNGAELNAIKELLGHSSLAATQVYTHTSIQKLKDAHSKAHPKG